ncbi:substrate-binding domain-containing protein [Paractinoplanes ferrugineus]|uniref:LacI family transcriptional regulator n=1 Tax=Paractinoplanes ferrugineus TaxID=113564 RepID=A0A919J8I0_9ACTN|nr:substrate-binding domain-containing protein [Actinoplanes ferrugineus]GIE15252.1 LacI family transcriptional regulator [Actinoplanes ferrugineus]
MSGTIGLVLTATLAPRVGVEPFFIDLVAGLEDVLMPAGGMVLLLVVEDTAEELATYERWAADRTVDAVVVVNLVHGDARPARLVALGLPAVLAGRCPGPAGLSSVVADNAGAIRAAMKLLAGLGHHTIGRVSGPAALLHTAERTAEMRACAQRLRVGVRIVEADYSAEAGVRAARRLLAGPEPLTAIVFDNDVMAVAAEEDLVRSGVAVPDQVSLLAGDDSTLCELAMPPLSAMSIDVHEHGVTLGRAVLDVLDGEPHRVYPGPPIQVRLRASTGPAPSAG